MRGFYFVNNLICVENNGCFNKPSMSLVLELIRRKKKKKKRFNKIYKVTILKIFFLYAYDFVND